MNIELLIAGSWQNIPTVLSKEEALKALGYYMGTREITTAAKIGGSDDVIIVWRKVAMAHVRSASDPDGAIAEDYATGRG